jgi:hypothetical protein
MTEAFCETSVIIMHTFKVKVAEGEWTNLVDVLTSEQIVVLSEKNSGTCYFIIPAEDAETFERVARSANCCAEKISISELREKYSEDQYRTLYGDARLIETLFR